MMQVRWLRPDDPAWLEHLTRVSHDIYHLPGYVETSAQSDGGEPWALLITQQEASLFVPLLVREVPAELNVEGWHDATTPYGYPTPLLQSPVETATQQLLAALKDALRERHIVSLFCRLHPLLPLPSAPLNASGKLVQHGQTVLVPLQVDDLPKQWRSNHRRDIKKLSKQQFVAREHPWQDIAIFQTLYQETMSRLDAGAYYFFDDAYFHYLKAALADKLHLWIVTDVAGTAAAAGLFTCYQGIVQYHLGATATPYLRQAPSKLMFAEVMDWAHAQGAKYMHLGGGLGGREDSLFHFKAGFSKQRADFFTYRMVTDPHAYDILCKHWQERRHAPLDTTFFPAYRK